MYREYFILAWQLQSDYIHQNSIFCAIKVNIKSVISSIINTIIIEMFYDHTTKKKQT